MSGDNGDLKDLCRRLQEELDEARKEAGYYKRIAAESGKKRLRDIELLSNAALERDASERARLSLEAEYQKAKKIEAIGMLAGGVAHDLNNVLGGIVGYPDLVLTKLPKDSPVRNLIIAMKESGRKAAAIVKDMLILARKGMEAKSPVNLNSVIAEYLRSPEYDKLMESHPGIFVKTKLNHDLSPVMGSMHHLSKVIMNLVSNAAEAMNEDGTIWISTRNDHVKVLNAIFGEIPQGNYAVVEIEDTGVGISMEDMERIFEPFYTKKVMGRNGTGLGMAVVWSSIKDHKGFIDVRSMPGDGSVFTLYFPITDVEPVKIDDAESTADFMGSNEDILVVDDVRDQREIASAMLSSMGYSVVSVSSGEQAIEHVKENPVDLIILDMIMDPGMDGLDTYKHIRAISPGLKTVIVSGFSETDRLREALRLSNGVFVKKPYVIQKLGLAVQNVLSKK